MYEPKPYPKYITTPAGFAGIVQDHLTHSAISGEEYGPDGELVAPPAPAAEADPPPIDPDPPSAPLVKMPTEADPPPIDPDPPAATPEPAQPNGKGKANGKGKGKGKDKSDQPESDSDEDISGMFGAKE